MVGAVLLEPPPLNSMYNNEKQFYNEMGMRVGYLGSLGSLCSLGLHGLLHGG
jgi:hypothetical protein